MSKPKVYVETTFVSYLTARPSLDAIIAGHQQASQRWWDTQRERFELCTSQRVIQEAGVGDVEMAKARLSVLAAMTLLETTEPALALAKRLVGKGVMPIKAAEDALHLAIAAVNGGAYLLTWNYKHLANATLRKQIERVCLESGLEPPVICTPEELYED